MRTRQHAFSSPLALCALGALLASPRLGAQVDPEVVFPAPPAQREAPAPAPTEPAVVDH